jgi:hypothetical protein
MRGGTCCSSICRHPVWCLQRYTRCRVLMSSAQRAVCCLPCSVTANRIAASGKIIAGLIDIAQDPLVTGSGGDRPCSVWFCINLMVVDKACELVNSADALHAMEVGSGACRL